MIMIMKTIQNQTDKELVDRINELKTRRGGLAEIEREAIRKELAKRAVNQFLGEGFAK